MRAETASYKAIEYACLKFHYAKRLPAQPMIGFNIYENENWCGVIVFNGGIRNIESPFGLARGQVAELVRVALNGKQSKTSKCLALAIKLFKKHNPLVKLLVSYADSDQEHFGTIYQATNWIYIGSHKTGDQYIDPKTGKSVHSRSHSPTGKRKQFGVIKNVVKTQDLIRIKTGVKHKYIYIFDPLLKHEWKKKALPYPKKSGVDGVCSNTPSFQDGEDVQVDLNAPSDEEYYV